MIGAAVAGFGECFTLSGHERCEGGGDPGQRVLVPRKYFESRAPESCKEEKLYFAPLSSFLTSSSPSASMPGWLRGGGIQRGGKKGEEGAKAAR